MQSLNDILNEEFTESEKVIYIIPVGDYFNRVFLKFSDDMMLEIGQHIPHSIIKKRSSSFSVLAFAVKANHGGTLNHLLKDMLPDYKIITL